MKRTGADAGRFAVVTPEGKRRRRRDRNNKTGGLMKTVVKRRKNAETRLQKAVRQNCLIIDAYNSKKKLKIDDKWTEADDVIHCIHHSDLDMLDNYCRFITSVSQIPNSPFSAVSYA